MPLQRDLKHRTSLWVTRQSHHTRADTAPHALTKEDSDETSCAPTHSMPLLQGNTFPRTAPAERRIVLLVQHRWKDIQGRRKEASMWTNVTIACDYPSCHEAILRKEDNVIAGNCRFHVMCWNFLKGGRDDLFGQPKQKGVGNA